MLLAEKQSVSENSYNSSKLVLRHCTDRRKNLKLFLTIVGFSLCLMVANLWVQVVVVKQNNQIKGCQEAIRTLERESIKIRIEMANLESFERVQTVAQKELHMKIAGPGDYRCIAAAPSLPQNEPRPYNFVAKSIPQNTRLLAKVVSWFEGFRTAMAQSN
jgi:cell division protein FtsL